MFSIKFRKRIAIFIFIMHVSMLCAASAQTFMTSCSDKVRCALLEETFTAINKELCM